MKEKFKFWLAHNSYIRCSVEEFDTHRIVSIQVGSDLVGFILTQAVVIGALWYFF